MASLEVYLKQDFIDNIIEVATRAGDSVAKVYQCSFQQSQRAVARQVQIKAKADGSPVTIADKLAHDIIETELAAITPDIPILSEEGEHFTWQERQTWDRYWLVDPLDGTKEFINQNGEFTVNIALIDKGVPVIGVVYAPVSQKLYFASCNVGSFKSNRARSFNKRLNILKLSQKNLLTETVTAVVSRSHKTPELKDYLLTLEKNCQKLKIVELGSSLKLCHIAEGTANIYPKLGVTSEWDTAAGHAIVKYAGGYCYNLGSTTELKYNTKECLINPDFIVSDRLSLIEMSLLNEY